VANTLNLLSNGAVGFIDWLGEFSSKECPRWTKVNERDDKAVECEPNMIKSWFIP